MKRQERDPQWMAGGRWIVGALAVAVMALGFGIAPAIGSAVGSSWGPAILIIAVCVIAFGVIVWLSSRLSKK